MPWLASRHTTYSKLGLGTTEYPCGSPEIPPEIGDDVAALAFSFWGALSPQKSAMTQFREATASCVAACDAEAGMRVCDLMSVFQVGNLRGAGGAPLD